MVNLDSGDLENAQYYAEEALRLAQSNNEKWVEGNSMVWLGKILGKAKKSQNDKAQGNILQGIKILDELKMRPHCSVGYLFLGELYTDTGQKKKALETLKEAEAAFQEMGMDYWLRRTQEVLERVQA